MNGDYDLGIDLLAEPYQILLGGMTGCVKIFFDGKSFFSELVYKVIQNLVESSIVLSLVNISMEL